MDISGTFLEYHIKTSLGHIGDLLETFCGHLVDIIGTLPISEISVVHISNTLGTFSTFIFASFEFLVGRI